jgi:hypothetical protein
MAAGGTRAIACDAQLYNQLQMCMQAQSLQAGGLGDLVCSASV